MHCGQDHDFNRFGKKLVTDGLLDKAIAEQAQEQANNSKIPFVTYLVKSALIDPLAVALSQPVKNLVSLT